MSLPQVLRTSVQHRSLPQELHKSMLRVQRKSWVQLLHKLQEMCMLVPHTSQRRVRHT
jgi:hypothetical protein